MKAEKIKRNGLRERPAPMGLSLPGPSRTIIVEPLEAPQKAPQPVPAAPEPEPVPKPEPEKTPA